MDKTYDSFGKGSSDYNTDMLPGIHGEYISPWILETEAGLSHISEENTYSQMRRHVACT